MVVDRNRKTRRVTPEYSAVEGIGWAKDGRSLLLSASPNGMALHVYRADLGGTARLAMPSAGTLTLQDITADGRWLVTRDDQSNALIARAPGQTADRDISWLDRSILPNVSADGQWVAAFNTPEGAEFRRRRI